MAVIAVYNLKGGVGKTSLAVNLAWCSAVRSARRTLLWDLDPQAAASFILRADAKRPAQSGLSRETTLEKLISQTAIPGLDILPADRSLRGADSFFDTLGKKRRLARLTESLEVGYDRIILDCAPGLTPMSEQAMRAADIVVVPLIPSPLSRRALDEVAQHIDRTLKGKVPILPVFSMVDRRRALHREALAENPDWPNVPMASAVEQMAVRRLPLGSYALRAPAMPAVEAVWIGIERKLAKLKGKR
jgi:chromosome partitioning protein